MFTMTDNSLWHFQVHRIGLTWRTGYIKFVSTIGLKEHDLNCNFAAVHFRER